MSTDDQRDDDTPATAGLYVKAPAELLAALREIRDESGVQLRALVVGILSRGLGLPPDPAVERAVRRYRRG